MVQVILCFSQVFQVFSEHHQGVASTESNVVNRTSFSKKISDLFLSFNNYCQYFWKANFGNTLYITFHGIYSSSTTKIWPINSGNPYYFGLRYVRTCYGTSRTYSTLLIIEIFFYVLPFFKSFYNVLTSINKNKTTATTK